MIPWYVLSYGPLQSIVREAGQTDPPSERQPTFALAAVLIFFFFVAFVLFFFCAVVFFFVVAGFVPPEFGNLANLVVLNLSWNFLSGKWVDHSAKNVKRMCDVIFYQVFAQNTGRQQKTVGSKRFLGVVNRSCGVFSGRGRSNT